MSAVERLRAEVAVLRSELEALRGELQVLGLDLGGRLDQVDDDLELLAGAVRNGSSLGRG